MQNSFLKIVIHSAMGFCQCDISHNKRFHPNWVNKCLLEKKLVKIIILGYVEVICWDYLYRLDSIWRRPRIFRIYANTKTYICIVINIHITFAYISLCNFYTSPLNKSNLILSLLIFKEIYSLEKLNNFSKFTKLISEITNESAWFGWDPVPTPPKAFTLRK